MLARRSNMLSGLPAHVWRARRSQFRLPSFRSEDKAEEGRTSPENEGGAVEFPDNFDPNQLRDLNAALDVLTSLFPDVRAEVFRELLLAFSEESRLELVAEQLIKHKAKWVKGRWRVPVKHEPEYKYKYRADPPARGATEGLSEQDKFRSNTYKTAVKTAFYQEFKSLNRSTITAVLAEYNYSYTDTRPTLLALSSKSWKSSLSNLIFLRRKAPSPVDHPLILWQQTSSGSFYPILKSTPNEELNAELRQTLIAPLRQKKIEEQITQDAALADQLNEEQAEAAEATFDCEVCFVPNTFEQMTVCDNGGHYICFRCVRHTMKEVLYGQGWARGINASRSTLRCIAPASGNSDECGGCVSHDLVRRALGDTKEGKETWTKFEERAAGESLIKSQTRLTKCPFCVYAEVDEGDAAPQPSHHNLKLLRAAIILVPFISLWDLMRHTLVAATVLMLSIAALTLPQHHLTRLLTALQHSIRASPPAPAVLKFQCRNPACARASCLTCHKEWRDIHQCHASEKQALRAHVESAMADAVKRTCPRCHLSFVKSAACNKMTCLCGYVMCYVCRAAIPRDLGYAHFCQHFRAVPNLPCADCDRCDLYRTEDDDVLVRKAKERAEREWREREGFEGGWRWEDTNVLDT